MRIARLAFGRDGLDLDLPDGFRVEVLEARSASALADPRGALEQALDAPIAAAPLAELASGKRSASISVCDITRPAPNRFVLPSVLRRLEAAGVPRDGIRILIATGLHRPATEAEIREIAGPEIAATYTVLNHHARNREEHRFLGETAAGTPVWIDERFVSADLRLSLGFIEPHLMLGYSGGRKLVAPGLAAQETIKVLHSPRFMREPKAVEGSIEDNPLHRELLEIARLAGQSFIVDVALAHDRSIAGVFAGHPEEAHRAGVRFVSAALLQTLPEPADLVITTGAGYPLDLTFYQCIKGVTAAARLVKPGGRILLAAECAEGSGGAEFSALIGRHATPDEYLEAIRGTDVIVDQWQLEKLALVARQAEMHWYVPGLPASYARGVWGTVHATFAEAVRGATAGLRPGALIAAIPHGPYVLARAQAA
ncbi:MAG TPA: nickel-dependent lactate racemase [Solibacterales bacterium]|nr:nickel-dependent lactate racemase [Bryobacterales bacterium]